MSNSFYITTPIFYVNDVPHIGHAYTSIACDVIARFKRLQSVQVKYLTGCDEHGQKVEQSAAKQNKTPQEFVDQYSQSFRDMMAKLNISNDDFIRTTEQRHKEAVSHFWQELSNKGAIYKGSYSGWYSVRDEAFYTKDELDEDGRAPTGAPVEWVEEPSYFFALSKYQDQLLEFYEKNPDFITPNSARNEVINFVKNGLNDLSISRSSFKWGIGVPGDSEHVIYVWLDALTNYISALGYPNQAGDFTQYWPYAHHVIGKDILRFHAIFWPAFLMAANLPLPNKIIAHGWWTNEGQKISKSLGNVIDPFDLVQKYGLDQVRYFLMREITFGKDGNFSHDNMVSRVNSELSNKIGNLLQRVASFAFKQCNASIPNINQQQIAALYSGDLMMLAQEVVAKNDSEMRQFNINQILDNILAIADQANLYMDQQAPWALKKTDPVKMQEVLYLLLESVRYIAIMLQPFMPESASKMLDQLSVPQAHRKFEHLNVKYCLEPGLKIAQPQAIFPRVDS